MSDAYINIKLTGAEMRTLMQMAKEDCRPMHEQMRYFLHEAARARGILSPGQNEERPRLSQQSALREA